MSQTQIATAGTDPAVKMMHGRNQLLRAVLESDSRYEIPAYQRGYQWDAERWQDLVADIVRAATAPPGASGANEPYWIGIMIVSNIPTPGGGIDDRTLRVIDGQQRIVTLLCWLKALYDHGADDGYGPVGDVTKLIRIDVQEKDHAAMAVVMGGTWRSAENRELLGDGPLAAYCYFRSLLHLGDKALTSPVPPDRPSFVGLGASEDPLERVRTYPAGPTHDLQELYAATLDRIALFGMTYASSENSEAGLFDALNGKRTELEPLDYMRSTLFVRLDEREAQSLYEKAWKPRESDLYEVKLQGVKPGRNFPYDFLISLGDPQINGGISAGRAHVAFTRLLARHDYKRTFLKKLVSDELLPAMTAWPAVVCERDWVLRSNGNTRPVPPALMELMQSIFSLSRQPMNPLVLRILVTWNSGRLSPDEAAESLGMAESYVARWILAGWRLNSLRSDVMAVMTRLAGTCNPDAVRLALLAGQWATDDDVRREVKMRPFYDAGGPRPAALGALLRGIERGLSGGEWPTFQIGRAKDDYSIEHIYPQKPALWQADLRKWRQDRAVMDERLHCLGNLTVVTQQHNKKVKNKILVDKQGEQSLRAAQKLHINTNWLEADRWTAGAVDKRTTLLIETAIKHWARG